MFALENIVIVAVAVKMVAFNAVLYGLVLDASSPGDSRIGRDGLTKVSE